MKSGELIKLALKKGWKEVRVVGSHHHFKHDDYPELLTIPHPKKDLGKGLVSKIKRVGRL